MKLDFEKLGLKAGLEIHQQLDTKAKLFCNCPTKLRNIEDSNGEFTRYLQPMQSELGEVDQAALAEAVLKRKFIYKTYDTTCLVENDEEPPRCMNEEALKISLEIALLLNMQIVEQVHVMRKIVIDGSNTSGFQRTALVATNGYVETSEGRVRINSLCLEEEAAQIVAIDKDSVIYSLDRLGIPLVEIGTAPDIKSPQHAKEVAKQIGMILRSTRKVKRGIGTIRQDVNISIEGGARVELKGVQDLDLLDVIVEREVLRQVNLLEIQEELRKRNAIDFPPEIYDVTEIFIDTKSTIIANAIKNKGKVLAARLPKFKSILGREIQPGRRFGSELADYAKRFGVGGILHTDELPNYGITTEELTALRKRIQADKNDCIILIADFENRARNAILAAIERAKKAIIGIPEETRRVLTDGNSSYLRPLPGAARMYPETDVPPIAIDLDLLEKIRASLPETLESKKNRYMKQFGLNRELAGLIANSMNFELFEQVMTQYIDISPTIVVRTLEVIPQELKREGIPVSQLSEEHYLQIFDLLSKQKLAKEGISSVLRQLALNPEKSAEEAAKELGLGIAMEQEIEKVIQQIVAEKKEFIKQSGKRALNPLMGLAMKHFRGKVDGKLVSKLLEQKIEEVLKEVK
ncbi:MAG: Glu-tRNA(Gln) amidotransferase subunit GatE [Methanocellales archaeon]